MYSLPFNLQKLIEISEYIDHEFTNMSSLILLYFQYFHSYNQIHSYNFFSTQALTIGINYQQHSTSLIKKKGNEGLIHKKFRMYKIYKRKYKLNI